jgi:hypothetical protein
MASLPSFNADPHVAVPLNNASVSEPLSYFLYNSLDVDSYLSSVSVEFPFLSCCVLIWIVIAEGIGLLYINNTSSNREFGKQA